MTIKPILNWVTMVCHYKNRRNLFKYKLLFNAFLPCLGFNKNVNPFPRSPQECEISWNLSTLKQNYLHGCIFIAKCAFLPLYSNPLCEWDRSLDYITLVRMSKLSHLSILHTSYKLWEFCTEMNLSLPSTSSGFSLLDKYLPSLKVS